MRHSVQMESDVPVEIWAKCHKWPDYEASSIGRVRRWRGGKVDGEPRLLKDHANTLGYRIVQISYGDKKRHIEHRRKTVFYNDGDHRQVGVHRLVADAFMGPCAKGYEVNHKDGVKDNNCAENLEYVTHKENIQHAIRLFGNWARRGAKHWAFGRPVPDGVRKKMSDAKRGGKHWAAKHVDPDEIKRLYADGNGMIMRDIAAKLGVSRTCVGDVIRGTHWTVGGYRTNRKDVVA